MSSKEFEYQLLRFRDSFSNQLIFNVESSKRLQWKIEETLQFLDSEQFSDGLEIRVQKARTYLKEAYKNAGAFSDKMMKPDPKDKDLGAISSDDSFWYQEVIGTAEAAIDTITRYLNNNE